MQMLTKHSSVVGMPTAVCLFFYKKYDLSYKDRRAEGEFYYKSAVCGHRRMCVIIFLTDDIVHVTSISI